MFKIRNVRNEKIVTEIKVFIDKTNSKLDTREEKINCF